MADSAGDTSRPCPVCEYDLRAHASVCVCPECGFKSDSNTRIVKLFRGRQYLETALEALVVCALLVLAIWHYGRRTGSNPWLFLPFLAVYVFVYLRRYTRAVSEPSRLLLTRRGIMFENLQDEWIPWCDVGAAKYSWLRGRLVVLGKQRQKLLWIHYKELGSPRKARECVRAIKDRLAAYRDRPA